MLSLEGVINEPGNPVISCWMASDGHYAFVEFRNAHEANLGFRLQGMNINGTEIKIGRPKSYENTMQQLGINVGGGLGSLTSTAQNLLGNVENMHDGTGGNEGSENSKSNKLPFGGRLSETIEPQYRVTLPSRVLVIRNLVTFEASRDLYDFKDLYSDLYDKCSEFGKVI